MSNTNGHGKTRSYYIVLACDCSFIIERGPTTSPVLGETVRCYHHEAQQIVSIDEVEFAEDNGEYNYDV